MANLTVGQIIVDAQRMASRVKDLDVLSGGLLMEAEGNNRHIESMRQFQDDLDSLNRIVRDKSNADMVNRINQQNPCIREIRQENRELKLALEDHQRTLEVIMHKYREHTQSKIISTQINFKDMYNETLWGIIRQQAEKINEMAAVMQRAASIDEGSYYKDIEIMTKLKTENQTLREMLQISNKFESAGKRITLNGHLLEDKAIQTDYTLPVCNDQEFASSLTSANMVNNNSLIKSDAEPLLNCSSIEMGNNNLTIPKTPTSTETATDNSLTLNSVVPNAPAPGLEKTIKNTLNLSNSNNSSSTSNDDKNTKTLEIPTNTSVPSANEQAT